MTSVEQNEQVGTIESVKTPGAYCCVIYNDDITTMDFVVMAICVVFGKTSFESAKIMTHIHNHGKAKIGRYCYDIAVTKKQAVDALAIEHGFPLRTEVEEV